MGLKIDSGFGIQMKLEGRSFLIKILRTLTSNLSILPNRSHVLPVNMRCERAAVGQYEVASRGVRICFKSVGLFRWFFLYLVCTIFQVNWFSLTLFFANLCISFPYFFLACFFRTVQIVCCLFIDCAA